MRSTTQILLVLMLFFTSMLTANAENNSAWLTSSQMKISYSPIFIQIFKEEKLLELYTKDEKGLFNLVKSYPICNFSGGLGPKTVMGDLKSPEGFYRVKTAQLNPNSRFYRAINLGFPNEYDQFHGYSGDYLMIHGDCKSVGCYAMTDAYMDEIYRYAQDALRHGQTEININIYPFRMTAENMDRYRNSSHIAFWRQLAPAYRYFEQYKVPAPISIENGAYVVNSTIKSSQDEKLKTATPKLLKLSLNR